MVAMDFFAALNCYDFLNQYCSNLLKNPTVRGLRGMFANCTHIIVSLLKAWKVTLVGIECDECCLLTSFQVKIYMLTL